LAGVSPQRRHHGRHARDHAQRIEPCCARGLRNRPYSRAQEGDRKVARDYPNVTFEEMMIDSISMKLVTAPQQFDVVVTTNQFGDILTDIGAGLVGGLGLAPGLCVGERQAMAQATHGSAPDIAGRNIANPYAMITSGQMLLAWLGRKRNEPKAIAAADRI